VIGALIEAGRRFPNSQLPELWCGFQRDLRFSSRPADYLVLHPAAWVRGHGLPLPARPPRMQPDLNTQRLLLDPALPAWLDRIDVRDMRIFDSRVTFRVRRNQRATASWAVAAVTRAAATA